MVKRRAEMCGWLHGAGLREGTRQVGMPGSPPNQDRMSWKVLIRTSEREVTVWRVRVCRPFGAVHASMITWDRHLG